MTIINLLEKIHYEDGVTVILITHDPELAQRAEETIRVLDGRVEQKPQKVMMK